MINLKIFYGSQTGNAQDVAEKVYRFSQNLPPKYASVKIGEMNDVAFDSLSQNDIFIFICSTTGQGDPPDNMKHFWQCVMKRSFNPNLSCLDFAVFGLGDSKYNKYNFIAKKLYRRLIQLKANSMINIGLADDQHSLGIDGEFSLWIKLLWKVLEDRLNKFITVKNLFENCYTNAILEKYNIVVKDNGCLNGKLQTTNSNYDISSLCPSGFDVFTVKYNVPMTPISHFQDTRLIAFDNKNLKYDVGDVLSIYPQNSKIEVDLFFELTNLCRNTLLTIKRNLNFKIPSIFVSNSLSFENIVYYGLDLNSVPRKSFFEHFAFISDDKVEKERLQELSDAENIDELYSYCFQPKRTIIEVLQDFPNTSKYINISQWINLIPFIRPRDYSIASSNVVHNGEIQVLVSRVKYKTKMFNPRIGLCSNFLCDLKPSDIVFSRIKKGTLKFPDSYFPLILISPGTGIAAFRGYICERMLANNIGQTLLCFGSRYKNRDFYFASEFKSFCKNNNFKLLTAFSREEKVYIQDKLKEQSELIWKIIKEPSGFLFISGRSVDMPQQVHNEIKNIIIKEGGISEKEAANILNVMEKHKRYQIETWS